MSRDEIYLLVLYCEFTIDTMNAFFIESQGEMCWHLHYYNRQVEFSIINLYVTFILKPSVLYSQHPRRASVLPNPKNNLTCNFFLRHQYMDVCQRCTFYTALGIHNSSAKQCENRLVCEIHLKHGIISSTSAADSLHTYF